MRLLTVIFIINFKIIFSQTVSTFAGSTDGYLDANGTSAKFRNPTGLAFDNLGNLYVADSDNMLIRKIAPNGDVSTFAGSGNMDYVDATGTAAAFRFPKDVALDASGNVYVVDYGNNVIRKITPAGVVTTLAGSPGPGNSDGVGTLAKFNGPRGVAVDASGNVFVADYSNSIIRKITPGGVVSTFAGSTFGYLDGIGTAAKFSYPTQIAIDADDNLYVTDGANNMVRKITPNAVVSTLAGSTTSGSVNGVGTNARFSFPYGIAVDEYKTLYVSEFDNHAIRKIDSTGKVTTIAGSLPFGFANGSLATAKFNNPTGLALDNAGNLYIADYTNDKIRKISNVVCHNSTKPILSASATTICGGSLTTITINSGLLNDATNWKWYSSGCGVDSVGIGTSIVVTPTTTTTYYVRGEGGCVENAICGNIKIETTPSIIISATPATTLCTGQTIDLNAGSFSSYTWSNGFNGQTITVSSSGTYTVEVVDAGGCIGTGAITVFFDPCLSTDPVFEPGTFVKVFPNPLVDSYLSINSKVKLSAIQVLDISGQLLLSKNDLNDYTGMLNLQSILSGMYFLRIFDSNQNVIFYGKIVVN